MTLAPRRIQSVISLAILLLGSLAASAGSSGGPAWYEIRPGDSLGRIARDFGTTVAALRDANGLRSDVIHPGQRLEIVDPFACTQVGDLSWRRPLARRARVIAEFGPYEVDRILMPRSGVDLDAAVGTEVVVPAHGVLRFLAFMEELGTVAILDHGAGRHTVLSPLDPATVPWQPGQALRRGDVLGRTAPPPGVDQPPHLHVELRVDGKAVRPDCLVD